MRHLSGSVVAIAVLAEALYERNELAEAERLLNLYLPVLKVVAAADQLITSYRVLARISRLGGDTERADLLLAELEALGHEKSLARLVASARLERSRVALLQGNLQRARELLDSAGSARIWTPLRDLATHANDIESPTLARIRLDLHSGAAEQSASAARQALEQAQALQRHRQALTLRILLGQALCADGDAGQGKTCLLEALQWAATDGFVRAFADEGPALLALLADLRGNRGLSDSAKALLDTLLAGHEESTPAAPADLLSERELGVLRLLAEGLRNREIADRLFVSETTVRTHLRNINVKLDSQSRTHAVAIARQLGLLD
ncbi:Transcriptional regulatory protein LiaR [compost metagenome]